MVLRTSVGRHAPRVFRPGCQVLPGSRRGLAAPASGSFQYESGETSGVKWACRDLAGPTCTLALVSSAGTRYQQRPGLSESLEKFAFRNTHRRSALRLQREAELFGATLFASHSRECVLIGAKFFRDDLPYFTEVLSEVAKYTKYLDYEWNEQVKHYMRLKSEEVTESPRQVAISSAYSIAFHRGLGEPLHPPLAQPLSKHVNEWIIEQFGTHAYQKSNVALVANGTDGEELSHWVGEFFGDLRTEPIPHPPGFPSYRVPPIERVQTKYYGGQERIDHYTGNSLVLAFPGSSSLTGGFYKPEIAVLAKLLGGKSTIKWSPGFSLLSKVAEERPGLEISTHSDIYSDAGLLYITMNGPAEAIKAAAPEVVSTLKKVANGEISKEVFEKARAQAKFRELEYGQEILAGLELSGSGLLHDGKPYQLDESAKKIGEVTQDQVQKAAATLFEFKSSVAACGDLHHLPYGEELGLLV